MEYFKNAAGQTVAKDSRGSWRIYTPETGLFGQFAKGPEPKPKVATPAPECAQPKEMEMGIATEKKKWDMKTIALVALGVLVAILLLQDYPTGNIVRMEPKMYGESKTMVPGGASNPFLDAAPPGHRFVGATAPDRKYCEERGGQIVPDTSQKPIKTERGWARPNKCTADDLK